MAQRQHKIANDPLSLDFGSDKPFYVYLYRDPRPRKRQAPIYVGKGKVLDARAEVHWKGHVKSRYNPLLRAVLQKIQATNLHPIIEIIAWFDSEPEAFGLEAALIARYGRRDLKRGPLLNLTDGGEGPVGHRHSPQQRAKQSAAQRGRKHSAEWCANMSAVRLGKPRSAETIAKMSASKRGRPLSDKQREQLAKAQAASWTANRGKKRSDEIIEKMRANGVGNWLHTAEVNAKRAAAVRAPEVRAKISKALLGKRRGPLSAETKAKLSEAHKGRTPTEAARDRMSKSALERWARMAPEERAQTIWPKNRRKNA